MEFSPSNEVVKYCLQGMAMEEKGLVDEASLLFHRAWNEAEYDFEKFISAHYISRCQSDNSEKLKWLKKTLEFGLIINDDSVVCAFPNLYSDIARCYEAMNDLVNVKVNSRLASSVQDKPTASGPFYHGTKAKLQTGSLLTAGGISNYKPELEMNHIYFTALASNAGLAAALANGDGKERVYIVEPTGLFEHDPNVTNKKFPSNPTRSYRSHFPLEIVGEVTDWKKQTPDELKKFRSKLATNGGEIIN